MSNAFTFSLGNIKLPDFSNMKLNLPGTTPAATPAAVSTPAPAAKNYMSEMERLYPDFYASNEQVRQAAGQLLPMYQARLGGFDSATGQAMRLQGDRAIQAQYGNALNAAVNRASAGGVRGAAGAAMQNDVRNQMGQATANFNTDLTAKNWDAQTQALNNYSDIVNLNRGGILGSLAGLQQQTNIDKGYEQQLAALTAQIEAAKKNGGLFGQSGGLMNTLVSPQTIVGLPKTPDYLNPMSWLGGVNLG